MSNVKLSIIIVSYNNLNVLLDCLNSVEKMNDISDQQEVIVVEQSPSDEIYTYLKKNMPQIQTIRAENKGFGAGNNRGVEIAQGEYLLFLNPDTVLVEPIAGFALDVFGRNPKIGLFGVGLLDGEKNKNSSFECLIPYGLKSKITYSFCYKFDRFLKNKMYIQGADMFVRADLFRKAGSFDENVFMYYEEPDLCLRVRREGYEIAFFKEKKIIHLQGACSPDGYDKTFSEQLKSFRYFSVRQAFQIKAKHFDLKPGKAPGENRIELFPALFCQNQFFRIMADKLRAGRDVGTGIFGEFFK